MAHSRFSIRRMFAVIALTLAVTGVTLSASAVMAESSQVVQPQAGHTNRVITSDDELMAIIAKNIAAGITSTKTYFSNGIFRTVVTLSDGTTITGCHDKELRPIPCP